MERIYIAQGERGLFKVGKTTNFPKRLIALRQEFKRRGDILVRHHAFPEIHRAYGAEWSLFSKIAETHASRGGREWFEGVNFEAAIEIGNELTTRYASVRPVSPETLARWAEEGAASRAQREEARAKRKAFILECKRATAYRRFLRAHGERAFEAIVRCAAPTDNAQAA